MVANMQERLPLKIYILLNRLNIIDKNANTVTDLQQNTVIYQITADKMWTFMQKLSRVFGWQTQHIANKAYQSDQQKWKSVKNV